MCTIRRNNNNRQTETETCRNYFSCHFEVNLEEWMCVWLIADICISFSDWCFELATRCLIIKVCLAQEDAGFEALHGEGISLSEHQSGIQTVGDHHVMVSGMGVNLNLIQFMVYFEEQGRAGEVNLSVIWVFRLIRERLNLVNRPHVPEAGTLAQGVIALKRRGDSICRCLIQLWAWNLTPR